MGTGRSALIINLFPARVLGSVLWTVLPGIRESVHTANDQFQDTAGVCTHTWAIGLACQEERWRLVCLPLESLSVQGVE